MTASSNARLAVSARGPAIVSVAVRFPRRGRRVLGAPRLDLWDPLGLCRREVEGGGASGELLVLPRIEEVRRAGGGGGREAGLLDGLDQGGGGSGRRDRGRGPRAGRPAPVPPGEPGVADPLADGRPQRRDVRAPVRGRAPTRRRSSSSTPRAPDSPEALDRAVRAAASLCLHLARRGGCAILLGDRGAPTLVDPRMRVWADVHARLALVESGSPAPAPRQARGRVATFWVTGAPAGRAGRVSAACHAGLLRAEPAARRAASPWRSRWPNARLSSPRRRRGARRRR